MRTRHKTHRSGFRIVTAAAAIALLGLTAPRGGQAGAANSAMPVVKSVVNTALQVLADKHSPLQTRQERLRQIVNAHFDFATMSRFALGYHWRSLKDEQRKEFTCTFTAFIQDSYLSKIQDYSGQTVRFGTESYPDPGYAEVKTSVVQEGRQPVPVNYMLRQVNGQWLIYDVTVDNISIIANYRNQFNRVINQKGFDTLLTDLKSKQQQLAAELGTLHHHD